MSRLRPAAAALARIGDAWDAAAYAVRRTPGRVRASLAERGPRRVGIVAAAVGLVVYLFSIGDVAVSTGGRWAQLPLFSGAPEAVFRMRAPYVFEPVLAFAPSAHLVVFLSPLNLMLGAGIAALAGANLAVAVHARREAACRTGYGRVLGILPAFLLGFACCAPTLLLVLGTGTASALLPLFLPLRPIFYPLALVLLLSTLSWGARRVAIATER